MELVIDRLNLPNAGEDIVKGQGELFVDQGKLLIRHNSIESGIDYSKIPDDGNDDNWESACYERKVSETIVLAAHPGR